MALATTDYEIMWAFAFLLTLFTTDYAWDHLPFAVGREVGYATILTWIRATGWMGITTLLWFLMAELTIAFNAGINSFASANQGSILGVFPFIFYGFFFFHLVITIVITAYLVLPTERMPRSFQFFSKQNEGERQRMGGDEAG